MAKNNLPTPSTRGEIDAFIAKVRSRPAARPVAGPGRLIFALDATASREATWDRACRIQGEMFGATASLGGLAVQLVYYRGFGEFHATPWLTDTHALVRDMTGVFCLGGRTQIGKMLRHALAESQAHAVNAVVFVGDCLEESIDRLSETAGRLGLVGVPVFIFHEGDDVHAARGFAQIAKLTGGACCPFDSASADQLRQLLAAVAVFAAGGLPALEDYGKREGGDVLRLTSQLAAARQVR